MKFFTLLLASFLFTFNAHAVVMRIKAPAIVGEITTEGLTITDSQMTLSCRFVKGNQPGHLERIMYPFTSHQQTGEGVYAVRIKSANYWEILPSFELKNCAYKLIVIAKDKNGRTLLGDLVLLGSEKEFMSAAEFERMKREIQDAERLFNPLHLFLAHDQFGRLVLKFETRQK